MALMKFREPNQVKWQGSRPAHDGTEIHKHTYATAATQIVYTVPAGKYFHLCTAVLNMMMPVASTGRIEVWTAVPAVEYYIMATNIQANTNLLPHVATFWPPLELDPGWSIRITVAGVGSGGYAMIFGWVE